MRVRPLSFEAAAAGAVERRGKKLAESLGVLRV